MKFSRFIKSTTLLLTFLVSCQTGTPTNIPSPMVTATITASPTPTSDPEIISPDNANQLILKWMNMGTAIGESAYSPDGKWLYQASTAGTYAFDTVSYQNVQVLDSSPLTPPSPSSQQLSELEPFPEYAVQPEVLGTIFSPDGSLIARYFHANFVAVWRLADGKLINRFEIEGRPKELSPDNRLLTVERSVQYETYDRPFVDLYDLQTGEQLRSWSTTQAFFLSDGRMAVETDSYTRIFDPNTGKVQHAFAGRFAAFSSDEQTVAVLYGNQIHIYRVAEGKLLHKMDSGLTNTGAAVLRFSANGQILAGYTIEYYCCAGYSARLAIWQVEDGSLLIDLSQRASTSFSLSPDGQTIVIDSQVLRTSNGSLIADIGASFIGPVTNLTFTPDGQQILVASSQDLYLYPVDGQLPKRPQMADSTTYLPNPYPDDQIDLSPDRKLRVKSYKGVVTILSESGQEEPYTIPVYRVRRLTFSPDGQILALGLLDGSIVLWNVNSKQMIDTIPPRIDDNRSAVGGLAFSSDGKLLAIGLNDGTVRLYGINVR